MPVKRRKTSRRTARSASSSRASAAGAADALVALSRALRRVGARWYLFGAQAVALHGAARATQDIDVTVLGDFEVGELLEALRAEGIEPRLTDRKFLALTRVIPAVHRASGWGVDVVLGGAGLEELIAAGATPRRVGPATVPLLRLEHLLTLKLLAGRPRDLADASRLLQLHAGAVGLEEVRDLLRQLEQALAEDGLVARLEALVTAQPRRTLPARPPAPRPRRR
jgi:hypothetical protein